MENSITRTQRNLIAVVQVLALSVWFSLSAVFPSLRVVWNIDSTQLAWLVGVVQIGFVVGAVLSAWFGLSERINPKNLLASSAALAGLFTALLPVFESFWVAIVLRFATGVALAGIYPIGMQLMASWSSPKQRGEALGLLLAAIVVGSSLPHLIHSQSEIKWQLVVWTSAALAVLSALMCLCCIRPGPYAVKPKPKKAKRSIHKVFPNGAARLINIGYFGHMWELYAWWAWLPSFYLAMRHQSEVSSSTSLTIFLILGIAGAAGCLIGGWAADKIGRTNAAAYALAISGACCVLSPFAFSMPLIVVLIFLSIWGAAVVADSGVFSTALSENVSSEFVGTALTIQTAIGYLITNISMLGVPALADWLGWRYAFLLLVPGPIAGIWAMIRLNYLSRRDGARYGHL